MPTNASGSPPPASGGPPSPSSPPRDAVELWSGERQILPGVTLSQTGGHFPGSAVVHWAGGADGRGVLLSGAVATRVAEHVARRPFDRLYNNFADVVPADARDVVLRSAARHAAWARGDFDDLT
ncbi:hypothetical protein ACNHYB_12065 [Isoptericola jiangsuensis]|uniref:hypothetical protein n=1 Tax=Isoptericola jiangsuensis TaxID=548579 RepID=UPI003AADA7C3